MAPLVDTSFSVIRNDVVITAGAVSMKLNDDPPFAVTSDGKPPPLGPYVGTLKSPDNPFAAPAASSTVTVHEITSLNRTYVVLPYVWPLHDNVDAAVADDTLNVNGLFDRTAKPRKLNLSVI